MDPRLADRFPDARVFAAPGVADVAGARMPTSHEVLQDGAPPAAWQDAFDQVLVPGSFMTEAVFFHRPSQTVILVDLIESFERVKVRCQPFWWLIKLALCAAPGSTPLDLRTTFWPRLSDVRGAVRRIVAWQSERVILAHGRWISEDGTAALRRALAWAL